jgi:uncharacterized protein YggE
VTIRKVKPMKRLASALVCAIAMTGCALYPGAMAQPPSPSHGAGAEGHAMPGDPAPDHSMPGQPMRGHAMHGAGMGMPPMSAIQPETTLSLSGRGAVLRAPDVASVSVGVNVEAKTAAEAMQQQASQMAGVFAAVRAAGIAERDMQTGSISLNPVYEYPDNARPRLTGYQASNVITLKVRKLDTLGRTLDAVVKGGGNTIHGVSFSVDEAESLRNEARTRAIRDAAAKAELYAAAVGYKVSRIVTISEQGDYSPPAPLMAMRIKDDGAAPETQIAAGDVSLEQTVSVLFELIRP